ncbi:MAG: phospholipid ABC transporter ATP-binding protein MlaF, partial [Pseudomonadota bacterium]
LGLTSIVVSHDVAETMAISDYVYVVSEGRVIEAGTPQTLGQSASPWVRQFLQGLPDGPVPFHYPSQDFTADLLIVR